MTKRLPKPVKLRVGLTEDAYAALRALNARHGLGNDYLLIVLLERLDDIADPERLEAAYRDFISEYDAPSKE